ncbi:MAG: GGDEF domain-containing protein [Chitinivorax sp.]
MQTTIRPLLLSLMLALPMASAAFDAARARLDLERDPAGIARQTQQFLQQHGATLQPDKRLDTLLLSAEASLLAEQEQALDAALQAGLQQAEAQHDNAALTRLLTLRARQQLRLGKPEVADTWREIGVLAATLNDPHLQAEVYAAKAGYLAARGLQQEALERSIQAWRVFEQNRDKARLPGLLAQIAGIQIELGELDDAFYYLGQARDLIRNADNPYINAQIEYLTGIALRKQGALGSATRSLTAALQFGARAGLQIQNARVAYELGQVGLAQGKLEEAEAYLLDAAQASHSSSDLAFRLQCELALADLRTRQHQPLALKHLDNAAQYATQLDSPARQADYEDQAATTRAEFGQMSEAYRHARNYANLAKKIAAAQTSAALSELQTQFQGERKEAENKLLRNQRTLQQLQLQQQQYERQKLILALLLALTLTSTIGVALFLVFRQRQRLHVLAMKDELTGASNRRSILAYANQHLQRLRRKDSTLMIAVLDLDHFKQINDNYGHNVGDLVLRAFANALTPQLRGGDRLGRIGGEEWLLVLPGLRPEIVPTLFQRLQETVHAIRVAGLPEQRTVTFSMGITMASARDDSIETTIQRADQALYLAKHEGRDCVRMLWRQSDPGAQAQETSPAA